MVVSHGVGGFQSGFYSNKQSEKTSAVNITACHCHIMPFEQITHFEGFEWLSKVRPTFLLGLCRYFFFSVFDLFTCKRKFDCSIREFPHSICYFECFKLQVHFYLFIYYLLHVLLSDLRTRINGMLSKIRHSKHSYFQMLVKFELSVFRQESEIAIIRQHSVRIHG